MNILVIMTDQLSFRLLRAYGGTDHFPAIDGIFERGTTLEQVYTPCPLCLPARASFWSSRLPHRTGALANGKQFANAEVDPSTPTLGSLFASSGWECIHFGKEHDAGALHGFRRMPGGEIRVEPQTGYPLNRDTFRDRFTAEQVVDFLRARTGSDADLLAVIDLINPHNICGWVGEMARHRLGEDADVVPRLPEAPPAGFPPAVPMETLPPLPPNHRDEDFTTRPISVQYQCCAHNRLAQTQGWGEREFRLYLDAYRYYTQLVDREVDRILGAAHESLDQEQTFVVFTSDHGDAIAAHSGATKHTTFYEETTRVPFAITGPGIRPGARLSGPTSLLDLVPTLVSLAGLRDKSADALSRMDGISQADRLLGAVPSVDGESRDRGRRYVVSEWHTEWGFTIEPGRMITDGRYKLMRYAEGREERLDEEFYDLDEDPWEKRNLVQVAHQRDGETREAIERLRHRLDEHFARSNDPFPSLQATVDPRWRAHPPGYHHHRGVAAPQA